MDDKSYGFRFAYHYGGRISLMKCGSFLNFRIMKCSASIKTVFIQSVCYLFAVLFVYAAVSKMLDFENFQVQLGQSPLLSAFARWISVLVLAAELMAALFLLTGRLRHIGLYFALSLMVMFTAYIFIILNYSSFIPCSCGGILEKMGWNAHLAFNIAFVFLAASAIVLDAWVGKARNAGYGFLAQAKWIAVAIAASISAVALLYLSSEEVMRHSNPFIRRYPHHPAEYSASFRLNNSSYYIAGFRGQRIYLGNYEFPSYLMSLDSSLSHQKMERISFSPDSIPFKNIYIRIQEPYFYLYDGSVPAVFRGDAKDWSITTAFKGVPYFTKLAPIDGASVAFRSNNSKKLANVLGVFNMESVPKISYRRNLLQKQIDGIFDTDGTLLYSEGMKKMVYLYYYRNEFIVADKYGSLAYRGHTIDTITHAKIKVSELKGGREFAMSAPADVVNSNAAVFENLLFVHSLVRGRYENEKLWKKSFIIDVYDLISGSYLMSFPIYHTSSSSLNSFAVAGGYLAAVIGNDLVVYQLKDALKKEIKKE
ncbi:MauE/DoxX family redox-associated membrane protein [Flavobacterium ginsenosidimutans]|uniref:MauE/DoxX family redox-associated membrane protein n=1 Tax=Flavobacterium ginsenosidimutans TaxID=687844 RepID=UPI000DADFC79|nr:MauE/DoxX family redox-associated membrane protein [Flavobacterium ginsenosidimutans]KAF2328104.1 DoxX family protein [Flavobacterium ginsenosidimutans]